MTPASENWIREKLTEEGGETPVIVSVSYDSATEKGNNYMSDIYRLNVKTETFSGGVQNVSLIYKVMPVTGIKMGHVESSGVFPKECKIYTDILPKMEQILHQKDPLCEIFWPKLIGATDNSDALLMEDVSVNGYRMGNRLEGLDFEHCVLSLKVLAKFHALSAVLHERGELEEEHFGTYYLFKSEEATRIRCSRWLENLALVLEQNWKGEWVNYAKRLRKLKDTVAPRIMQFLKRDDTKFNVLNHGDFWTNNILFRNDNNGNPINIKLIDFQMSLFGNPCMDVVYLFQTSLTKTCAKRKDELFTIYHSSLEQNLKLFGYKSEIPSLEKILKGYENSQTYAFMVALICKSIMIIPSLEDHQNAHPELDKSNMSLSIYTYDGQDFVDSLKNVLREGKHLGII